MGDAGAIETISIDLYADWIEILRDLLRQGGYTPDPGEPPLQVAVKYFNLQLRDISSTPRIVLRARDLAFEPQYSATLDEIERKATAGESLIPHLSKRLLDLNYHDPLLNDWGLHHLHLSIVVGKSGFVDRTGPLLLAHVTADTLYMVAVLAHGAWTNKELLEQILRNWPNLLEPYELRGVVGVEHQVTETEHAQLRTTHVQTILQLSNGKAYCSLGGGVTTAGSNVRAVMEHDRWAKIFRQIEREVRSSIPEWRMSLPSGVHFAQPPSFRLTFDNGDPVVVELSAKRGFRFSAGAG